MENIVALIAMVAFIALLAWLGVRASRTKSALAKWSGMVLTAMLAVSVFGVAALTAVGIVRQRARSAPVPDVRIEATPDQIDRGRAVADGFAPHVTRRPGR
ncbi:hypothetical protein [Bradyrhizobium japonicum]|uniref:hypothetical protein n=1 Tax=Bradyrhizobium japonicum TaxID=375 RepID=UPI000456D220|nr:hypothetical protein [Bradyrhizobium japonicum]AHY52400.1 hypothetical protein BJS_06036 [Bradyrhizobium japonicum SEMIA 5079]MCD9111675.1 hypothetical protein [Bradyrhizobium japonicum]MCD9255715.1 hypothetical protein [Bradyrhizobium japonicum SEMIA 5079]MCD9822777.1 hypothetical protein [Bradyrhizobium japonicum]MCD9893554.1 hypothetical protein [Bradyrhizobium japonicum]